MAVTLPSDASALNPLSPAYIQYTTSIIQWFASLIGVSSAFIQVRGR